MKTFDLEQGSLAWHGIRAGIPTSSNFSNIVTPLGKLSKSAEKYANKLVAEIYMKRPITNDFISFDMERGKILEAQAADAYEMVTGEKTTLAGFITDDDGKYGCSPDRFVGDKGLVEIKCLKPENHMEFLLSGELSAEHKPQVQGQLLICTDREWVDWWIYHPDLPALRVRNYRDEAYQKILAEALDGFWDLLLAKLDTLEKMGYLETPERGIVPAGQTIISAS